MNKVCIVCRTEYPKTLQYFTVSHLGGKNYWAKMCNKCKQRKQNQTRTKWGNLKMRNKTRQEEKDKARARDVYCIFPACTVKAMYTDNHHVYRKPSEILPKHVDRNSHVFCVCLCRYHHTLDKHEVVGSTVHEYCQVYLANLYKNTIPHTPLYTKDSPERLRELRDNLLTFSLVHATYTSTKAKSTLYQRGKSRSPTNN
jgi:hypothetical protein